MSKITIARFNEIHQAEFRKAPLFSTPKKQGPDHMPVITVELNCKFYDEIITGVGSNQREARQDAVNICVHKSAFDFEQY